MKLTQPVLAAWNSLPGWIQFGFAVVFAITLIWAVLRAARKSPSFGPNHSNALPAQQFERLAFEKSIPLPSAILSGQRDAERRRLEKIRRDEELRSKAMESQEAQTKLDSGMQIRDAMEAAQKRGLPLDKSNPGRLIPFRAKYFEETNSAVSFEVDVEGNELFVKVLKAINSPTIRTAYRNLETVRNFHDIAPHLCEAWCRHSALEVASESGTVMADLVIMPLVNIPSLYQFVRQACSPGGDREKLRLFGGEFRKLINILHDRKIVHGDYNALNILVTPDCKPFLLDFDTLSIAADYSPALSMVGVGAFQPPAKFLDMAPFHAAPERLDYFSEWIIYASLVAYSHFADHPGPESEERLFLDLKALHVGADAMPFRMLLRSGNYILTKLAEKILEACGGGAEIQNWLALEDMMGTGFYLDWERNRANQALDPRENTKQFLSGRLASIRRMNPSDSESNLEKFKI